MKETTVKVLAIVWVQNRSELNQIETKFIFDNREFLINKKSIKSLEEKRKEFIFDEYKKNLDLVDEVTFQKIESNISDEILVG